MSKRILAPTNFLVELYKQAGLDSSDSVNHDMEIILMRSGFEFHVVNHKYRMNIKGTYTGSSNIDFVAATSTIEIDDSADSWIDQGFVPGNKITTDDGSNSGPFTIVTVTSDVITVSEAVVDSANTSATVTANDELAVGNGYTTNTDIDFTVTEDETTNKAKIEATANIVWTASGGSIGPTPCALIIDRTHADEIIVACLEFGSERTVTTGNDFSLNNIDISGYVVIS